MDWRNGEGKQVKDWRRERKGRKWSTDIERKRAMKGEGQEMEQGRGKEERKGKTRRN